MSMKWPQRGSKWGNSTVIELPKWFGILLRESTARTWLFRIGKQVLKEKTASLVRWNLSAWLSEVWESEVPLAAPLRRLQISARTSDSRIGPDRRIRTRVSKTWT